MNNQHNKRSINNVRDLEHLQRLYLITPISAPPPPKKKKKKKTNCGLLEIDFIISLSKEKKRFQECVEDSLTNIQISNVTYTSCEKYYEIYYFIVCISEVSNKLIFC